VDWIQSTGYRILFRPDPCGCSQEPQTCQVPGINGRRHWASIADKHYNVFDGQPYAPLDEAIEWLGKEFGFKTQSARKPVG
jgi:hypothetical protein